jgi:hypothetical protein
MKVKVFTGYREMEAALNEWFKNNPEIEIKFTNATEAIAKNQYSADHKKSVYIFYEESKIEL